MKYFIFPNIKDEYFRYERKFYAEGLGAKELEAILRFHPAVFREIYYKRTVNNIYFDSFNLEHYFDNINGTDRRLKVRIRWYGDLFGFIENPMLELKLKHNLHVGKLLYPLKSFTLDNNFSINVMCDVFRESSLHEALKLYLMELDFSLLNSYDRKYFLSSSQEYRVTIDADMQAYKLSPHHSNFLHKLKGCFHTVLELKYNRAQDDLADSITGHLPFRLQRSSKYVDGITKLHMG